MKPYLITPLLLSCQAANLREEQLDLQQGQIELLQEQNTLLQEQVAQLEVKVTSLENLWENTTPGSRLNAVESEEKKR